MRHEAVQITIKRSFIFRLISRGGQSVDIFFNASIVELPSISIWLFSIMVILDSGMPIPARLTIAMSAEE